MRLHSCVAQGPGIVDTHGVPEDCLLYNGTELGDLKALMSSPDAFTTSYQRFTADLPMRIKAPHKKLPSPLRFALWEDEHVSTNPINPYHTARRFWQSPEQYDIALRLVKSSIYAAIASSRYIPNADKPRYGALNFPSMSPHTASPVDEPTRANAAAFTQWASRNQWAGWLGPILPNCFCYKYGNYTYDGTEYGPVIASLRGHFARPRAVPTVVPVIRVRYENETDELVPVETHRTMLADFKAQGVLDCIIWETVDAVEPGQRDRLIRLVSEGIGRVVEAAKGVG